MNKQNKLEDWLDLANVVETIRLSRGDIQAKALEMYIDKGLEYLKKYGESFNHLNRPK